MHQINEGNFPQIGLGLETQQIIALLELSWMAER